MTKGKVFVVSAPSGAGKTTLCKMLLNAGGVINSVSYSTRPPRVGEKDGVDYNFISVEQFERYIAEGEFIEWASVHGNLYGTSKKWLEDQVDAGRDVLLEIDPQGAMQLKEKLDDCVYIFIIASYETLKERLSLRGTDSEEDVALRLNNALKELGYVWQYDYYVVNEDVDRAFEQLKSVVCAEKIKIKNVKNIREVIPNIDEVLNGTA